MKVVQHRIRDAVPKIHFVGEFFGGWSGKRWRQCHKKKMALSDENNHSLALKLVVLLASVFAIS